MGVAPAILLLAGVLSVQGFDPYFSYAKPSRSVMRINLDQATAYRGSKNYTGEPSYFLELIQGLIGSLKVDLGGSSPGYSYSFSGTPVVDFCSDPNGFYPDPTDCRKYLQCAYGVPASYSCGEGTLYSTSCKCCEWTANVQCTNQALKGSLTTTVSGALTGSIEGSIKGSVAGSVSMAITDKGKYRTVNYQIHELEYALSGGPSDTTKAFIRAAINGEGFTSDDLLSSFTSGSGGILSSFTSGSGGILSSLASGSVSGSLNGSIDASFMDEDGNIESKTYNFDNVAFNAGGESGATGGGYSDLVGNDVDGDFGDTLRKIAEDLGIASE